MKGLYFKTETLPSGTLKRFNFYNFLTYVNKFMNRSGFGKGSKSPSLTLVGRVVCLCSSNTSWGE